MKHTSERTVLITGGAGFIGANLAERLLSDPGTKVRILDNFSRPGVVHNLAWLQSIAGSGQLEVIEGDIRDSRRVQQAVHGISEIYHLAAQVAVTSSLADPKTDFDINVRGTLNVLEAGRLSGNHPFILFTSTNKVYGSLDRLQLKVEGNHYRVLDDGFKGVNESEPLDFHSPYGCSKGAADQYVRDYARIYDLPTIVFRMSCIAGPRQFGNEDQGWVAHCLYRILHNQSVTIFGTGYQVRDVLHVHDLIDAMIGSRKALDRTKGQVYNVGGGMNRAVSVINLLEQIQTDNPQARLKIEYKPARPGDQPLYITETTKLQSHTGWQPRRTLADTLRSIRCFWDTNKENIHESAAPALTEAVA